MANGAKKAIAKLLACKAEGICERDKLVNLYFKKRIDVYERRMQTINEAYRDENDLPRCPPDCDKDDEVLVIEQKAVIL